MLELAILGELEQPLHGYELRKRLSRSLGTVRRLSFGSLYPALHRLADAGLIEVVDQGGIPTKPTRAAGTTASAKAAARAKAAAENTAPQATVPTDKTKRQVQYRITQKGREFLTKALETAAVDDESMPLTVGLMSRATPATRLTLLMQRRAQVLERHAASQQAGQSSDFWIRSRGELDAQQALSELSWIDRLIQSDQTLSQLAPGQYPDTNTVKN